jgi:hypothetical protein
MTNNVNLYSRSCYIPHHNHNYNNGDRQQQHDDKLKGKDKDRECHGRLPSNCFNHLYNRVFAAAAPGPRSRGSGKENALTICDYMSSMKSEINPSNHYRKDIIILLSNLSTFFKNAKSFKGNNEGRHIITAGTLGNQSRQLGVMALLGVTCT